MKSNFLMNGYQPAAGRTGNNCQGDGDIHFQLLLATAKEQNISDKVVTLFLLQCITNDTRGERLEANFALCKHNANLGG
jgi:pseudouridine-5'-phosphate glycosidase